MKHILMTALLFVLALQAEAGTLGYGLETMIADMDDQDVIKVLVVMQGQSDIRSLDKSLHSRQAPLAELDDYQSKLKSMTGGEGSYTMQLSHYDAVPDQIAEDLVAKFAARRA